MEASTVILRPGGKEKPSERMEGNESGTWRFGHQRGRESSGSIWVSG